MMSTPDGDAAWNKSVERDEHVEGATDAEQLLRQHPWPDDEVIVELWARYGIDPSQPFEDQEDRYRALFRDPWFAEVDRARRQNYAANGVPVQRRSSANGSVGAAIALGFRQVFDQEKAETVVMAERRDGDDDGPLGLDFDPENPKTTKAVIRRR
jgi:hypothetical protein